MRAARTREDLPIPGSPSINTEPPRPSANSVMLLTSIASSGSRPTSAPAEVTVGTLRTLLLEHKGNKRSFWTMAINLILAGTTITTRSLPHHKMQLSRDISAQPSGHIPLHGEMNISGHKSSALLLAVSVRKFAIEVAWIWSEEGNISAGAK